ncbi:MAG TPA: asparagine synthase (glutamine-hydrolyzing) [Longimicrobiales bacterium]|nr:asparagine synthase (glutamine-hydrolyzing) [Longimicrobiales bacterium]
MCGIAGVVSFGGAPPPTRELLRSMCDEIVHRGPDDDGYDVCDEVGLGMRRLSVIDLEGGHQPIFNEDRSVRVVYNGEIYNYRELRCELEGKGHRFATASDTEVIVHLWEEHGASFPTRLNGMFAIALYDARRRRVLLARDHVGIKPLFYALGRDHLVFGSEVKALLASGLVERGLDLDALGELLAWEYVPGEGTLLRSIRKLEAAHTLELDLSSPDPSTSPRISSFWDVPRPRHVPGDARSPSEWVDEVDDAIRRCVQRQLVSDVPLGAFLSGGVDSSLVVAGMGPAKTFSIGFDDPTYNELEWAKRVAAHLGVSHDFDVIQPTVVDLFDDLMRFMDDPIGDFSIFPTFLISRHARRAVTVALSGDGGDELFGGYETYVAQEKARLWERLPGFLRAAVAGAVSALRPTAKKKGLVNKAKRFVEGLEHPAALGHARWRLFVGDALRRSLFTREALAGMSDDAGRHIRELRARSETRDELDRSLYVDFKSYLVDNCLVKVDRMSMACSLETRVPLLDTELVELAFRVPSHLKVSGTTKDLLKRVAVRHVPRECVYRPKEGFSIPMKHWLGTEFRPLLEELLAPSRIASEGIFQPDTVARLKTEHLGGRANHSHVLWTLLVFQDWRRRWRV